MGPLKYFSVEDIKALRVGVDALIQKVNADGTHEQGPRTSDGVQLYSQAQYQAHTKLIEAEMWLGKMLEGLGNPFPPDLADKADLVNS